VTEIGSSRTLRNLKSALEREATNLRRYRWFARVAEIEGHGNAARALRKLQEAIEGHADGTLDLLTAVGDPTTGLPLGSTSHNLYAAVTAEQDATKRLYQDMAEIAEREGFLQIAGWFLTLVRSKEAHAKRLKSLLATHDDT